MSLLDILYLSLRNLREAKLRATLTTMGVLVGVAVIVTMVSFGLGLQRNTVSRFKELDLFNEITVVGRTLSSIATGSNEKEGRRGPMGRLDQTPERLLDDAAIAEIAQIRGVAYVEPTIIFGTYLRANGRVRMQMVGGAAVPNQASRFKQFSAGGMIGSADAAEAVVDESFLNNFGFAKPEDAIGQTVEFLDLSKEKKERAEGDEEEVPNFFGIPLEEDEGRDLPEGSLDVRPFRIVGVLKNELTEGGKGGKRFRGLMPAAGIYISSTAARRWTLDHRSEMSEVALLLARQSGALKENETEGYGTAVVRVTDPLMMNDVRKRLTELGFANFSIMDQMEQLRTVFLIMNSVLGLLGGISLLVASFGIANTMIMSILERTREIGIMKAIGAEDREIKLIFFVEAAAIGLTGGVLGSLAAWGIDALANRLAYRFILKPQGASFIDFFALPPLLWLGAILFALIVSVVAALYPASRAARIDPVRALRHD